MIVLITGIVCIVMALQLHMILVLYNKVDDLEQKLKSMNHDINMVSKTVTNQKQILKG
jgi:hypothetical protein